MASGSMFFQFVWKIWVSGSSWIVSGDSVIMCSRAKISFLLMIGGQIVFKF